MALNIGPESKVTLCLDAFIRSVDEDFSAPNQSSFQSNMPKIKREIQSLEEVRGRGEKIREERTLKGGKESVEKRILYY